MASDETVQDLRARVDALERSLREAQASNSRLLAHLTLVDKRLLGIERNRVFRLWGAVWRRVIAMRNGRRPPGSGSRDTAYRQWIAQVESPAWAGFTSTPGAPALISVLTRDVETVRSTLEQQTYTNWEVTANVASASGEYVLFLNGSGRMPNYALAAMAQGAAAFHADLLYADEDHLDDAGHRTAPVFKPAWSPELLRSTPYLGAPLLVRRELLVSLGTVDGLDSDHGLYGLAVAISSRTDRIVHVPVVLFHRNETNDSSMAHKSVAPEHTDGEQNRLAVIVCSRNPNLLRRCLRAVVGSARAPLQLIAVEHRLGGPDPEMTRVVGEFGAVSVPWYGAFNFAAMNNAGASLATAPYLLFLNDDVTVAGAGWAAKVIRELANPNIGVAGSVLRYPGGSVQHAGIVLGIGDGVGHVARFETDTPLWPWLRLTRDVSAVTGAFFAVGSQLFRELGGFDPAFPNNYNDVDFCLRARAAGFRVVCVANSEIVHEECKTRPGLTYLAERERLYARWGNHIGEADPYYSPNLAASERVTFSSPADHPLAYLSTVTEGDGPSHWPLRYNPVGRKENP